MSIYADVTARIIAALEQGVAPWVQPWSESAATSSVGMPRNGITGRPYSGINRLVLAMAGRTDARWYTYNQAQGAGGQVRKGEKGQRIYLFRPAKPAEVADDEGERPRVTVKTFVVFTHGQCAWSSNQASEPGAPADRLGFETARALIDGLGARVRAGARAEYDARTDTITMPPIEAFDSEGGYWATFLHEAAHWSGYWMRLNRPTVIARQAGDYALEELIAELTSAYLCAAAGIDGQLQHAEYIAGWVDLLRHDPQAIGKAAQAASAAADYLIGEAVAAEGEDEAA